jgi:hypothetical protein
MEYKYVRTNSKGEKIFRKDTNESLDFVTKFLEDRNIEYETRIGGSLIYIYNDEGKCYAYYWTTGRWSAHRAIAHKHYRSDGIEDFVSRFLCNKKEASNENPDL